MAKKRDQVPQSQRKADDQTQPQAQIQGQWDSRYCTKEYYDYEMTLMPQGAIPADMTKHAAHGSYSPLFWYQDRKFTCVDCGRREVWTAAQQRWWYEEAKGTIYSRAVRCRTCREAFRNKHDGTPRRLQTERQK